MNTMRHLVSFFILFIATKSIAQNRFLTIESNTITIDNVWIHDSIAAGKPQFTATMDITLRDGPDTKTILTRLQSMITDGKPAAIQLTSVNMNMDVIEERTYNGVTILEMSFTNLNATEKSAAGIRLRFRSSNMSTSYALKKLAIPISKSLPALAANFRISIPSKDTRRVAAINNISVGNNGKQFFTLDISAADSKLWHDALTKETGKTEQATIEWLAPNLKDVLFTVVVSDAEIVSYSTQSSNESRAIGKITVGLKARSIILTK
jgi:hypothetical protein